LATFGIEIADALNAAPFAGMTQTGSTGLISAAPLPFLSRRRERKRRARHPWPMA
jgi:hypothetical protein